MHAQRAILVLAVALALGYVWLRGGFTGLVGGRPTAEAAAEMAALDEAVARGELSEATVAAGCFWCVEADFDKLPGVVATISGYTGGRVAAPTYAQVSGGGTGHVEAVRVIYDPARLSYAEILEHFWRNVDPLATYGQFCDVGEQYRGAIFFHSDAQREAAEASRAHVQEAFADPVAVRIAPAGPFYAAEPYHQDYYRKNALQYRFYRWSCGRDARLAEVWGGG